MTATTAKAHRTDKLLGSALLLLLGLTILGLFARYFAWASMAVSFQHLWLAGSVVLAPLLALRRRWIWLALAMAATGYHALSVLPIYRSPQVQEADPMKRGFRVITANLKGRNDNYAKVLDLVTSRQPDLLFTQETYAKWREKLDPVLMEQFPHRTTRRHFGIYSRWPIRDTTLVGLGKDQRPAVRFDWEHPSGTISVLGVHPMTPRLGKWASRNQELEAIGRLAAELPSPALVIGDLNTSLWDPAFADFQQTRGLEHARQGHGILPSYCKIDYFLGLTHSRTYTGVPIDHVFFTPDFHCKQAALVKRIGSDHYPFEADLIWTRNE